jgi:predicted nicotinamide N-methyase
MNATRRLPQTPEDALGPTVREKVFIDDKTFVITHPGESDKLLDHPAVRAAFAADEYMPYWADLWPSARMMAKIILREPWPEADPPLEVLEIGCGLGLPGIAALSRGLRVIFSDYDSTALRFAADNARINGFREPQFRTLAMDWRDPPEDLRVPVILASDLIYEERSVAPVVALIKRLLAPDGTCLLTDQDRTPAPLLRAAIPEAGLTFTTQFVRAGEPGGRRYKGTLYRIRHAGTP